MNVEISRRRFLQATSVAGAGMLVLGSAPSLQAAGAARRLRLGVMGVHSRGMAHINGFLAQPEVEIAYVCDVDERALEPAAAAAAKRQGSRPRTVRDFRRILDDPQVDALAIAAPNHWHAPATILACAAGKHVYVEKPGSHNAAETELMVKAARHHRRLVQLGTQRRSWPWIMETMQALHEGVIGRIRFARTWYTNRRGSIGRGKPGPAPAWLDWNLWQGPAPERPFLDNIVHYNWHWRWHWGGGELANNGVHVLDLARWGLQVNRPQRVTSAGRRYHFEDDQETPDIYVTTFDFGACGASWESHSCDPHGFEGESFGVLFYGERGTLVLTNGKARILDPQDKLVREIQGPGGDGLHFANFVDAIRQGTPLSAPMEEGARSALLCHLGNIAWRTGQTVDLEASTGRIKGNRVASRLWSREYRRGWTPKV